MDLPTQTHLNALRGLLLFRLQGLQADVHATRMAQQDAGRAGGHEVIDRKDEATQSQSAQIDDAQAQRDLDELRLTEAALQRLEHGSYGDCADCGEPIALQRLLAQPAAQRCAACQSVHERTHRP
jgi:DnaK suppressor protein